MLAQGESFLWRIKQSSHMRCAILVDSGLQGRTATVFDWEHESYYASDLFLWSFFSTAKPAMPLS